MEVQKPKFLKYSLDEKNKYIQSLRDRINRGYLDSDKVMDGILEKLAGGFHDEVAKYC